MKEEAQLARFVLRDLVKPDLSGFLDGDWILTEDLNTENEIRLIQLADIGDGIFLNKTSKWISKKRATELNCTYLETGDILVSRMANPIARACLFPSLPYLCITVVDISIVRVNKENFSPDYIVFLFNSPPVRKQADTWASGTTRKRISKINLEKIKIAIPRISVQIKIAKLMQLLDESILIKQNLLKQLDVLKEILVKKSFANLQGEIKMLGEVGEIVTTKTPTKKIIKYYYPAEFLFIKPQDIPITSTPFFIKDSKIKISSSGLLSVPNIPKDSLLVSCIGTIGKIAITTQISAASQQFNAILPNTNFLPEFLFYQLTSLFKTIRPKITNQYLGGMPIINKTNLSKIKINIPDISMQDRIIKDIQSFERYYSHENKKLEQFIILKNGIMQKLF